MRTDTLQMGDSLADRRSKSYLHLGWPNPDLSRPDRLLKSCIEIPGARRWGRATVTAGSSCLVTLSTADRTSESGRKFIVSRLISSRRDASATLRMDSRTG